jgi:hypothetical protein
VHEPASNGRNAPASFTRDLGRLAAEQYRQGCGGLPYALAVLEPNYEHAKGLPPPDERDDQDLPGWWRSCRIEPEECGCD